ncbi:MAG: carbohydrate-binding protein, partial [Oscillospiraceae bacterium]
CNITNGRMPHGSNKIYTDSFPNVNHDESGRFIAEISDGTLIGYKYFDFDGTNKLTLTVRGDGCGEFEITDETEKILGKADVSPSASWTKISGNIDVPDGVHSLFLTYKGSGMVSLIELEFND